jgi:hypothetical protein
MIIVLGIAVVIQAVMLAVVVPVLMYTNRVEEKVRIND